MGYLHSLSKCPIKELEKLRIMILILATHRNQATGKNISHISEHLRAYTHNFLQWGFWCVPNKYSKINNTDIYKGMVIMISGRSVKMKFQNLFHLLRQLHPYSEMK